MLFMTITNYTIAFDLPLENAHIIVPLTADVVLHRSKLFYVVSNFRKANHNEVMMPKLEIMRMEGSWVHADSRKESTLSLVVGKAIDHVEQGV
jgi:hypothetical protein